MVFGLHRVRIRLTSSNLPIIRLWRQLLEGWLTADSPAQIEMRLELADSLPPFPEIAPFFTDTSSLPAGAGILHVYRADAEGVLLHYLDGALIRVPLDRNGAPAAEVKLIEGTLTPGAIGHGRFEDIVFTSLAPLLRRHGYFMVHAFAAVKNGRCALIIGPTGSGKTTTGLALLLAGWQLLSNDMVLLEQRGHLIYALPTPGIVNIRPKTLQLLPELRSLLAGKQPVYGKYNVTGEALTDGLWASPRPVTDLYFPYLESRAHTSLHHQNRAVALAQLMAESMDRWDEATLSPHLNLLQRLVRQAAAHKIHLGQDLSQIPVLFES